jgi:thiosulfate/3-mercaptopyruvate sulfurtransferase
MNHLIEAEALKNQLGSPDLIIVDLCNPSLYQQQHVPGAVHLSGQHLIAGVPPAPGACPEISKLSAVMAYLGIDNSKKVVLYDDEGGGWAGRMAWSMDLLGLNNWQYLNGGIVPWIKEGFATESSVNQPNSIEVDAVTVTCAKTRIVADEIIASIDNADFAVWDARSPGEYTGDTVRSARGGHIPNAINLEWTMLMDREKNLRIRDDAQQILDNLGLSKDKEIATHCQSHHRSSFTYMVAKILGYDRIRGYDGSWGEWGNLEHTPVELGPK